MDNFNHTQEQPFYNTIQLSESQWQDENKKAIALQKIVEAVFTGNIKLKISSTQMFRYVETLLINHQVVNMLSVRRCVSNLKNEMKIIKLKEMIQGEFGKPEHLYTLRTPENEKLEHFYKKGEETAADIALKMLSNSMTQKDLFGQ